MSDVNESGHAVTRSGGGADQDGRGQAERRIPTSFGTGRIPAARFSRVFGKTNAKDRALCGGAITRIDLYGDGSDNGWSVSFSAEAFGAVISDLQSPN